MKHIVKRAATLIFLFAAISIALILPGQPAAAAPQAQAMSMPRPIEYRASGVDNPVNNHAPQRVLGANAVSASMVVNFLAAGTQNSFGDNCQAWPAAAKTAFTAATDIWATSIVSAVPIKTNACWSTLGAGVLGHSGATAYKVYSAGAVPGYWYPAALANALAGTDLIAHDYADWDNDGADADAEFDIALGSGFSWYTGTSGIPGSGQYDLESVVLHEVGHGLGFLGWMDYSGGQGSWGYGSAFPAIYDHFTENAGGSSLINKTIFGNPSTALGSQLVSNNLYFNGPNAKAANGGNRPQLYAPSSWSGGSSYSHLGESFNGTPNALMTYSLGSREVQHSPGPVMLGILQDLGWTLPSAAPAQCYTLSVNANPSSAGTVQVSSAPNCSGGYLDGTTLTLTATAGSGYRFTGWIGCTGTAAPSTQLTVDGNENVTAVFASTSDSGSDPSTVFLPLVFR